MYAEVSDLKARLGDVFGAIYENESAAADDLADAEAEVDGCISRRFKTPVTAPRSLPLLRSWTLTLCEERTYSRAAGSAFAKKVSGRVAQVRKYLDDVKNGLFTLPGAEEGSENGSGGISLIAGNEPVFNRENMKGY